MDGFFLSIFLAVCIVVAILMRCLCYRLTCIRISGAQTADGLTGGDEVILPRSSNNPVITPARSRGGVSVAISENGLGDGGQNILPHPHGLTMAIPDSPSLLPHHGAVFTIYTFPQQNSPAISREPITPEPPKYSTLPIDCPPKYEDLFPLADFSMACKSSGTDNQNNEDAQSPVPLTILPGPQIVVEGTRTSTSDRRDVSGTTATTSTTSDSREVHGTSTTTTGVDTDVSGTEVPSTNTSASAGVRTTDTSTRTTTSDNRVADTTTTTGDNRVADTTTTTTTNDNRVASTTTHDSTGENTTEATTTTTISREVRDAEAAAARHSQSSSTASDLDAETSSPPPDYPPPPPPPEAAIDN